MKNKKDWETTICQGGGLFSLEITQLHNWSVTPTRATKKYALPNTPVLQMVLLQEIAEFLEISH